MLKNLKILISLAILLPYFPSLAAATTLVIDGVIEDKDGNGLPNIRVTAYRENEKIHKKEIRSGPTGKYRIEFEEGKPITDVFYQYTGWLVGSVQYISGFKGHTINKVLYRAGEKLPKSEMQNYVSSVSRLYEIQKPMGLPAAKSFYAEAVGFGVAVPIEVLAKMPSGISKFGLSAKKDSIYESIYDFTNTDGSFEKWDQLTKTAELDYRLKSKGSYTAIIPIDDAFGPKWMMKIYDNKNIAQSIILPRIIYGEHTFLELINKGAVETLEGSKFNNIHLLNPIATDIRAKNGIIHVVGSIYPSFKKGGVWPPPPNK